MIYLKRDPDVLRDTARVILNRIDPPRRKKETPRPPVITEFFGLSKAGKDTQLLELDRWFRRQKYHVLIRQESAESDAIRSMTRENPYIFEMRHFSYTFGNLLEASGSRDYHFVALNRGVVDTMVWLERLRRLGEITDQQNAVAKDFILSGPWMMVVDAFVYLTCDIETALEREFAHTKGPRIHGSRVNPKGLELMRECLESVYAELRERAPSLPIVRVDTTGRSISDVRDEILAHLLSSVTQRLVLQEDDLLPWCTAMLREKAWMTGPELKFRRRVPHGVLRNHGWQLTATTSEEDIYLTPKGQAFLSGNECFHLRRSGDVRYLVFKREGADSRRWSKIHVPIPDDLTDDILAAFDRVAVVRKRREVFMRGTFILNRDAVEGLGEFTEIKSSMPADDVVLLELALELGFSEDALSESYVKLQQRSDAERPILSAI